MSGRDVYLDSSAIVKRYVEEPGSGEVRLAYRLVGVAAAAGSVAC